MTKYRCTSQLRLKSPQTPWAEGPNQTQNPSGSVPRCGAAPCFALKTAATLTLRAARRPHVTPRWVRCRSGATVAAVHCAAITGDLFGANRKPTSQHLSCWRNLDRPTLSVTSSAGPWPFLYTYRAPTTLEWHNAWFSNMYTSLSLNSVRILVV